MLAYTGIETVSNMAEEARDPGEQVPKAVNLVLIAVLGIYAGISVVALSALPVHQNAAGHYVDRARHHLLRRPGAGDRLGARPARHDRDGRPLLRRRARGDDPADRDQRRDDRHLAPLLVAGRAPAAARRLRHAAPALPHPLVHDPLLLGDRGVLVLPGNTNFLGNLYSFGAMLSFTIAHLSIIALRRREPDRYRPYRAPWNVRWRGAEIPLTAVIGAIGTGAAFVSVIVLHPEARIIGTAWLVSGWPATCSTAAGSASTRARCSRCAARERPLDFLEVSYKSALVPIFGTEHRPRRDAPGGGVVDPDATVEAFYVLQNPARARAARRRLRRARSTRPAARSRTPACRPRPRPKVRVKPGPHPQPRARDRRGGAGARLGPDLRQHRARARATSACSARPPATSSPSDPAG